MIAVEAADEAALMSVVSLPPPPPVPASVVARATSLVDFLARLGYFLIMPLALYAVSLVVPLLGALINLGLALAFFAIGPLLETLLAKHPWLRRPLKRFRRFDTFYREHPPRMFIYYLFYPLLFPYWLIVRRARQEFLLYRGLSAVALVVMIGIGTYQYLTKWHPDIGLGVFAVLFGFVFLFQGVIVLATIPPLATTVISYHMAGKTKRLLVLLLASVLSTSLAIYLHSKKRHDTLPVMTMARLKARTFSDPPRANKTWSDALMAAVNTREFDPTADGITDVKGGMEVIGPPLDNARAVLESFYQDDEAGGFDLVVVYSKTHGPIAVLYVPDNNRRPLFLAMDRHHSTTTDESRLPPGTLDVLLKFAKK